MKYVLSSLRDYYAQRKGLADYSNGLDTKGKALCDIAINEVYNTVWYAKQWGFSGRDMAFTTVPTSSVGTVSCSAGEHILTVSGGTVSSPVNGLPLRGAYLYVGSKLYRIMDYTSSTYVLENPLTADVASGTTYKIYFIKYPVRWDIGAIRKVTLDDTKVLEVVTEQLNEAEVSEGEPDVIYVSGQSDAEFDTGTGTLTLGSNEVTAVSGVTLTDSSLIGKTLIKQGEFDPYIIIGVNSASTKLILNRPYGGTTASGATIIINPIGTPLFALKPYPTSRQVVRIHYTFQPPVLRASNDLTLLPNDVPILVGLDVMTTKWETVGEKGFVNEVLFQDKKFMASLKLLNFRGTSTRQRLHTANESAQTILRNSNPWNSFRGRLR